MDTNVVKLHFSSILATMKRENVLATVNMPQLPVINVVTINHLIDIVIKFCV